MTDVSVDIPNTTAHVVTRDHHFVGEGGWSPKDTTNQRAIDVLVAVKDGIRETMLLSRSVELALTKAVEDGRRETLEAVRRQGEETRELIHRDTEADLRARLARAESYAAKFVPPPER